MNKYPHIACAFAVVCLLASCGSNAPKQPPVGAVVTPAAKQESARVPLDRAGEVSSAANESAASARARLQDARRDAEQNKARVATLSGMLAELRKAGSATLKDLQRLQVEVTAQELLVDKLTAKLAGVAEDLDRERTLRVQAEKHLRDAYASVAGKEQEADTLRQQLADADATNAELRKNADHNFKSATKAVTSSARMEGQRDLLAKLLAGATLLLVGSLVVNYIQFKA